MKIVKKNKPCCCGGAETAAEETCTPAAMDPKDVQVVDTRLTFADRLGIWRVRWGIGRDRYSVAPGLYAVGQPGDKDPVFVSANYKFSFDVLRKELGGLNAWILVLDTKGVNVWCAAGKGTFGTDELVRRITAAGLASVVSHRKLILPQLSAPGVAGFEVKKRTGFSCLFGPVRAKDIKAYLENGYRADEAMRTVSFTLRERLAVVPAELMTVLKYFLVFIAVAGGYRLATGNFTVASLAAVAVPTLGAALTGMVVVPALLPWIPFRSFVLKGWLLGLAWAIGISVTQEAGLLQFAGNVLLLPMISAFLALNFTGATTFTSQNGVNKEIRLFARPMAVLGLLGIVLAALSH